MNRTLPLFLAAGLFAFTSCNEGNTKAEVKDAQEVSADAKQGATFRVDTTASQIHWEGHKKLDLGDAHDGTLKLSEGTLLMEGNQLKGGTFIINMNSIELSEQQKKDMNPDGQGKLIGHLKSDDFFNVANYPTSKFEITNVSPLDSGGYNAVISGNLTIREKTKNVTFPAKVNVNGDNVTAEANIIIDRSDYDVRYGSETYFPDVAANKLISNDLKLEVRLNANRAQ